MPEASVYDAAAFIQRELGPLSEYKLQKLVYYAQAWSLAWDDAPIFPQVIKAWTDGPVSPELWHREQNGIEGNPESLNVSARDTIRAVLDWYGRFSPKELIELSHREAPWRDARRGLEPSERGSTAISKSAMRQYYRELSDESTEKRIPDSVKRGTLCLLQIPEERVPDLQKRVPVESAALLSWLRGEQADPCHDS